ncbi:MAG: sugar transferase, partial [Clostridia bacterium]|nr:sugar transferase [Clostridia bacterium]
AIGVKLSSPGPILFKQRRVGKDNREFTMYKFRSMKVNTDQQTGWSNENDDRKTRFGAFIRKFALDELPQFYNVLIGDMSLVGPRPEVPFYVEKFRREIPLYMLKHTLRPGITGLAQIKGLRGDTSIQARIEEDINYIENWTFWGDIRILLLTPFHAINRHEKYVEREAQDAKRLQALEKRTYVRNYAAQPAETTEEASQTTPAKELPSVPEDIPTVVSPRGEAVVEKSSVEEEKKEPENELTDGDDFEEKIVRTPNAEKLIPAEETPAEEAVTDLFVTAAADAAPIATEGFQPKDPVNSLGEKTSASEDNGHADP